jgi:hypothetical protein
MQERKHNCTRNVRRCILYSNTQEFTNKEMGLDLWVKTRLLQNYYLCLLNGPLGSWRPLARISQLGDTSDLKSVDYRENEQFLTIPGWFAKPRLARIPRSFHMIRMARNNVLLSRISYFQRTGRQKGICFPFLQKNMFRPHGQYSSVTHQHHGGLIKH